MQKTLEEESNQLGFLKPLRYNTGTRLKSVFAQLRSKLCLAKNVTERLASEATFFL
jgi:hypothetical protein